MACLTLLLQSEQVSNELPHYNLKGKKDLLENMSQQTLANTIFAVLRTDSLASL